MPAPYGVTVDGFNVATFEELRDGMYTTIRNRTGTNPSDKTIEGIVVAIISDLLASSYEDVQIIYNATNRDDATGALLENLALVTGTTKQEPTASTVTLTLTGTNGTLVVAGKRAKNPNTEDVFVTTADATLATLTSWATSTSYTIGNRRSNASRSYICITAGNSNAVGPGPNTTAADITDGTVHWRYLGEGTAAADATSECAVTGPVIALSGQIAGEGSIVTPVGGWSSVINLLDATLGENEDSNQSLRLRMDADQARKGSAPIDALRSELLDVEGVTSVTIFMNVLDTPVTIVDDGPDVTLPPHSVEALVLGGDDQDIRDALLAGVAAGLRTFGFPGGLVTGTATDAVGNVYTIDFARPDEQEIYVDVTLTYDESYPADGDDRVKLAIVTYGDAQAVGRDAVASAIAGVIFRDVPGVLDCTVLVDLAPSPVNSIEPMGRHQIAVYDTSRIDVTSTSDDP